MDRDRFDLLTHIELLDVSLQCLITDALCDETKTLVATLLDEFIHFVRSVIQNDNGQLPSVFTRLL